MEHFQPDCGPVAVSEIRPVYLSEIRPVYTPVSTHPPIPPWGTFGA